MHSLPYLYGILYILCGLSFESLFDFISLKRPTDGIFLTLVYIESSPDSFEIFRQSFNIWNSYHAYWFIFTTFLFSILSLALKKVILLNSEVLQLAPLSINSMVQRTQEFVCTSNFNI